MVPAVNPLPAFGPPLTTLEPDDLQGWWIWYALSQGWRLPLLLGAGALGLIVAAVAVLAALRMLARFRAARRSDGPVEERPEEAREGLADLGLGGPRDA